MMFKKTLLATAVVAFGGFAMTASAATTVSTTFPVKITITSVCTVAPATATPIDFGSVPSNTAAGDPSLTKNNTLSVTCSNGALYNIGLSTVKGTDTQGDMVGSGTAAGDKVTYTLYQPTAAGNAITTTAWGNVAATYYSSTGTGAAQSINVYATVTNANHKIGPYLDTVTVNVIY